MKTNALLTSYRDMILSLNLGTVDGTCSVSKPLYLLAIMEAVQCGVLRENKIVFTNDFIRESFGRLYEQMNNNRKGFVSSFFIRPFFHLNTSPFYHLIWKEEIEAPKNSKTPSARYLRDNLLYAKFDDELWNLLQDAENRDYLRNSIIKRYLIYLN